MTGTCRICGEQVPVKNGRALNHVSKNTTGFCGGSDLKVVQ